jgi:hypothetical protein
MLRTTADAALRDYDGWWVLAHSLGSVVAFSGLMTPEGLIARFLDEPRWRRLKANAKAALFRDETKVPEDTRVNRPAWLEHDACVSHKQLFQRFRGLVTYGSPLTATPDGSRENAVLSKEQLQVTDGGIT